jgi:tRNA(Ile)-lysidine synthase
MMKKKLMVKKGHDWHLPVAQMKKQANSALWFELLHPYGFTEKQLLDLMHLCDSSSGRWVKAAESEYRLIRHRNHLILSILPVDEGELFLIERTTKELVYPGGKLTFKNTTGDKVKIKDDPLIANLDAKDIVYPLILRRVKAGDYFYPLGMPKKKKIARFMIDLKLSMAEKSHVWILESQNRIVWVVGKRIDDRFKVTEKTREVLTVGS